jgi:hypothetical protein
MRLHDFQLQSLFTTQSTASKADVLTTCMEKCWEHYLLSLHGRIYCIETKIMLILQERTIVSMVFILIFDTFSKFDELFYFYVHYKIISGCY